MQKRFCLLLLLACAPACSSLRMRMGGPSGKELGEQVGENVRAADEEVAAEASQNRGQSAFQSSYADALTSKEMVLVNPEVTKVMQETNGLASSLVERDGLCDRNWGAMCPDGWTLTGASQCVAPASYGGACKTVQSFAGKAAIEKQQIAEECQAPWPCEDDCHEGRDYSDLCPEGWSDTGGGFCEAPADVATKCATSYDFAEMSVKTKGELGQTCGFNWPCKVGCAQDFSKPCPEDWNEVPLNPGMCMAPATYAGLCGFSVNTTRMSSAQKDAFGRKCAAKFPCLSPGAAAARAAASAKDAGSMPDGPVDSTGQIIFSALITPSSFSAQPDWRALGRVEKLFQMPSGPET